ncbi:hypothetical protein SPONN_282 [uncultured Candidatus Thioglobus sp.]|nr:hypothetical protein SPONN_282 [uncultured Candidatus Thioglobus sp.]
MASLHQTQFDDLFPESCPGSPEVPFSAPVPDEYLDENGEPWLIPRTPKRCKTASSRRSLSNEMPFMKASGSSTLGGTKKRASKSGSRGGYSTSILVHKNSSRSGGNCSSALAHKQSSNNGSSSPNNSAPRCKQSSKSPTDDAPNDSAPRRKQSSKSPTDDAPNDSAPRRKQSSKSPTDDAPNDSAPRRKQSSKSPTDDGSSHQDVNSQMAAQPLHLAILLPLLLILQMNYQGGCWIQVNTQDHLNLLLVVSVVCPICQAQLRAGLN